MNKAVAIAAYLLICALMFGRGLDVYQDRSLFEPGTPGYVLNSVVLYAFGFIAAALGMFLIRILRAPGPKARKRAPGR